MFPVAAFAYVSSLTAELVAVSFNNSFPLVSKIDVPILGLVENMSYFICDNCNEKHFIFSNDGATKEAEKFQRA